MVSTVDDLTGLGKALTGLTEITKELRAFVFSLVGPAGEEAGMLLQDKIKYLRFKNILRTFEKAEKLLREKGITPQPVGLPVLVPVMEGSSLSEDENLVEKWAGLLASAAAGNSVHSSYPKILEQLTPIEARLLDSAYSSQNENSYYSVGRAIVGVDVHPLRAQEGITEDQFLVFAENLSRLGLWISVDGVNPYQDALFWSSSATERRFDFVALTALGIDFIRACQGPKP